MLQTKQDGLEPVFSRGQAFGELGGYTGVGVVAAPTSGKASFTALLAGGSCHPCMGDRCYNGDSDCASRHKTPARLFEGSLLAGKLSTRLVWEEAPPTGNRTGLLSQGGVDPRLAILLGGEAGFDLYRKDHIGVSQTFHLGPSGRGKSAGRFAGLATKTVMLGGSQQEIVVLGGRKSLPSVVALRWLAPDAKPQTLDIQNDSSKGFEVAGVEIAALRGTGSVEVVVANGAGDQAQKAYVYSLEPTSSSGFQVTQRVPLDQEPLQGRVVVSGKFFKDSTHPDVAIGTTDGIIRLYANRSDQGKLDFEYRTSVYLRTEETGFEIRGLSTLRLKSGLDALVAAVYNPGMSPDGERCELSKSTRPASGDTYLEHWPCDNGFLVYGRDSSL